MLFKSMQNIVKKNSLLWGEEVAETYHAAAARCMQENWDAIIFPLLQKHSIDYSDVVDFACGYGRNTDMLLNHARSITMVDVNEHNLDYCRNKYADHQSVSIVGCNGYTLEELSENRFSFFYTFDSVVHFPPEIVRSYLPEMHRVLKNGGYAFVHHSNYTAGGKDKDFRKNPHWRNYMSAELFADYAKGAGFNVIEQSLIDWEVVNLDCCTILQKP
ncbi:hypothetical protein GCM10011316_20830 [Roseibium aquae]|uniref:Methyltransferase domain-containing protein n=1 Tax=Roseibium aquae TaxID=1323746 RepID=A0A916TJP5_9HYPH|nr:class I SAM-dependent methyltransferase [Roseibium aquae]GGB48528.1 hypothetical protein GCM10011316_20830 [Roseibium aquae]